MTAETCINTKTRQRSRVRERRAAENIITIIKTVNNHRKSLFIPPRMRHGGYKMGFTAGRAVKSCLVPSSRLLRPRSSSRGCSGNAPSTSHSGCFHKAPKIKDEGENTLSSPPWNLGQPLAPQNRRLMYPQSRCPPNLQGWQGTTEINQKYSWLCPYKLL